MHPELFHVGPVTLRSYGVLMAVAFVAGTFLALREARRLGLDEDKVVNVILVTLIASVFGARLLYVLEHLPEFRREWTSALALWQGGLTLYGGIVAGTFAGLVAARRMGLPVWILADALTPSLALGTMFGRIGCFLNGCCYGQPTAQPWGVVFPRDSFAYLEFGDQPVHPSQLYNAFVGLALFAVVQATRGRFRVPGVMFWLFITTFALPPYERNGSGTPVTGAQPMVMSMLTMMWKNSAVVMPTAVRLANPSRAMDASRKPRNTTMPYRSTTVNEPNRPHSSPTTE